MTIQEAVGAMFNRSSFLPVRTSPSQFPLLRSGPFSFILTRTRPQRIRSQIVLSRVASYLIAPDRSGFVVLPYRFVALRTKSRRSVAVRTFPCSFSNSLMVDSSKSVLTSLCSVLKSQRPTNFDNFVVIRSRLNRSSFVALIRDSVTEALLNREDS